MPSGDIQIEGKSAEGQLVDLGTVKLELIMDMPGMPMHSSAPVNGSNGKYSASVKPQMRGDWTAKVSFDGPGGKGDASFRVTVQ